MRRGVVEDDLVGRIREKSGSSSHRFENAPFPLDAKVSVQTLDISDETDQALGFVSIEAINHEAPFGSRWITLNGLLNVVDKVNFSTGVATGWADDVTGGHIMIGNQGLGSVADILEFSALHLAWAHG